MKPNLIMNENHLDCVAIANDFKRSVIGKDLPGAKTFGDFHRWAFDWAGVDWRDIVKRSMRIAAGQGDEQEQQAFHSNLRCQAHYITQAPHSGFWGI